tara:strand:+ start:67 stop:585 length:519 start_codon:yes stop_codon:yes gene_type:complete
MQTLLVSIFVATYVSVKLIAYAIVIPTLPKYRYKLSDRGKKHYDDVLRDRRWKGILSLVLGLLVGIIVYSSYKNTTTKDSVYQKWANIIFITFWSMFVFYEIMWQHKFLFEESNLSGMIKEGNGLDAQDQQDLEIYADKYREMHLAENIINVVTFGLCIIVTFIFYMVLKRH